MGILHVTSALGGDFLSFYSENSVFRTIDEVYFTCKSNKTTTFDFCVLGTKLQPSSIYRPSLTAKFSKIIIKVIYYERVRYYETVVSNQII
jgi:hypothetical protein